MSRSPSIRSFAARSHAVAVCIALSWALPSHAVELLLVPEKSEVRYEIDHSLGAVKNVAGTPAGRVEMDSTEARQLHGRVTVDLRNLKTGVDQRDRHIKSDEYLDVEKYPAAEFDLTSVVPESAAPADTLPPGGWHARARGILHLHGESRDVEIPVVLAPEGPGLRVRGGWTLALEDYKIKRPKKMMLSAGKTVAVRVDLLFAP